MWERLFGKGTPGPATVAGTFLVGYHKEPFTVETLTSSKYITFMERALPVEAFAPERNTGFTVVNTIGEEDRLYWSLGAGVPHLS